MNVHELLHHDAFLRRLARALLEDAARADDVVQDAWMAVLKGRGAARDMRSWLAGVVRNLTRRAAREERRRARRERTSARAEAVRSTSDVVEGEEIRRRVADAMLRVSEPCRTALLLRYYDDLRPRDIARRLGVPGSTVRSRLKRGLELMRGELDAQHGGDRRSWCLALLPCAAGGAKTVPTAALVAGGVAAVALLAGLLYSGGVRESPRARGTPKANAPVNVQPGTASAPPGATRTPGPQADAPPPPAKEGFRGVVRAPEGVRLDGALVALVEMREGVPAERATATAEVKDGAFHFDAAPDGRHLLVVYDERHRPATAVVDLRNGVPLAEADLRVEEGVAITGRVTTASGVGLEGIHVRARLDHADGRRIEIPDSDLALLATDRGVEKLVLATRTDAEGRFRLAGLTPQSYTVWIEEVPGSHPSVAGTDDGPRFLRTVAAPAAGIDFHLRLATLVLRVRAGDAPLPHARVWTGGLRTGTDGKGRFEILARSGHDYELTVHKDGYVSESVTVTAPKAGGREEVVLDLEKKQGTATLVLRVRPDGPPLPKQFGFRLTAKENGFERTVPVVDGRCTLEGIDPGVYRLEARAGGWWLTKGGYYRCGELEVTLAAATTTEVDLPLEPAGRLQVLVKTLDGRTDVGAPIEVAPLGGEPLALTFLKGDDGGYVFLEGRLPGRTGPAIVAQPLPPGSYRVRVLDAVAEVRIRVGETTVAELAVTRE